MKLILIRLLANEDGRAEQNEKSGEVNLCWLLAGN